MKNKIKLGICPFCQRPPVPEIVCHNSIKIDTWCIYCDCGKVSIKDCKSLEEVLSEWNAGAVLDSEQPEQSFTDNSDRVWVWFVDNSYQQLICIRLKDDENFDSESLFHFQTKNQTFRFIELIKIAQ
jgi:hypothetical protein